MAKPSPEWPSCWPRPSPGLHLDDKLSTAFTALLCIRGTFFTGIALGRSQVTAAILGAATATPGARN